MSNLARVRHLSSSRMKQKKSSERKRKKAWKRGHCKIVVLFQAQVTLESCQIIREQEPQVNNFFEKTLMKLSKCQVDDLIVNYVVESTYPLSIVEKHAFIKLVQGFASYATVMTRKELYSCVESKYILTKRSSNELFRETEYLCTTADIWSTN